MYRVIVEKGNLGFSAAHFITYGGKCERLHGHNYAVSAELEGELTGDRYVFDFVVLKKIIRQICNDMDHYFLLPEKNEHLTIKKLEGEWEVRFQERRYLFPEKDVLPLPVDNATAERLAEYISEQVIKALPEEELPHLTALTVGVEESPGQTAFYRRLLSGEGA